MSSRVLKVTSHVGRDLLHAAAAFKTEAAVIWEYVVNALQYVDRGTTPIVNVRINQKGKVITISDNGRGMDATALEHYFTMHGENLERRAGTPGRGKFGTGKSAAFGIAKVLEIATVRNGLRNVVRLTRAAIDASGGDDIPLEWLVKDEASKESNGTIITISELLLPKVDTGGVIEYIERHLPFFRASMPQVAVNNHVCDYKEPKVSKTRSFRPSEDQRKVLGDVELVVKVSQAPLAETDQGVAVTAGPGNLVAIERGGVERKEFGPYLFGEVDVPALEDPNSPIAPYDSSRSLQLNPKHPVVAVLLGFLGSKLEEVRRELVDEKRLADQSEQARRLAAESDRIAELLNNDFGSLKQRLKEIRAAAGKGEVAASLFGEDDPADDEPDVWVKGIDEPGTVPNVDGPDGPGGGGEGGEPPNVTVIGEKDPDGNDLVSPAGGTSKKKRRPRGGFNVEFGNLGDEEDRSKYVPETMTIIINKDHPTVAAALGDGNVEDLGFRRLSYEIAFGEYSIALGYEMARYDPEIPADDLLYEVRTTLNRIARSSAALYKKEAVAAG